MSIEIEVKETTTVEPEDVADAILEAGDEELADILSHLVAKNKKGSFRRYRIEPVLAGSHIRRGEEDDVANFLLSFVAGIFEIDDEKLEQEFIKQARELAAKLLEDPEEAAEPLP